MSFAEYYLAYKLITDPDKNIRTLLMDRALSGERASLLYDTSKRELWEAKTSPIDNIVEAFYDAPQARSLGWVNQSTKTPSPFNAL